MEPYVVPPAGITAASLWVPAPVVDPAKPPAVLTPKIDPATGDRTSLFVGDDPTYQAIVMQFRTAFSSGISVQGKGNKFDTIRKNSDDAADLIRFEIARIFQPYVDSGRVTVLSVDVLAGPDAAWRGSATVRFKLLASGQDAEVRA